MSATTLPVATAPGATLSTRAALERMARGDTLVVAHLRTWQTTSDPDPDADEDEDDDDLDDEDEEDEEDEEEEEAKQPRLVVVGHSLGGWLRSPTDRATTGVAQPHLGATQLATLIRLGVIAPLPAQAARGVSLYAAGDAGGADALGAPAPATTPPVLRLDVTRFALSPLGSVALALGARLAIA